MENYKCYELLSLSSKVLPDFVKEQTPDKGQCEVHMKE